MNEIVCETPEFYVSYLATVTGLAKTLDGFVASITGIQPKDLPETALVDTRNGYNFYILYGDHREAYRKLAPNWQACYDYFLDHLDQVGHSSEMPYTVIN
jgi:hypothetical protein